MPSLRVPDRFKVGILALGGLSEGGYQELVRALDRAPECQTRKELLSWISDETPSLTSDGKEQIILALTAMLGVQRSSKVDPASFSHDVWESIALDASKVGVEKDLLQHRIAELLAKDSLDLPGTRVTAARTEVERSFCKVRGFTDLRPVFRDKGANVLTEMAIMHNLQIGYHDGMGKHHEFYITLDASDLLALKEVIAESEKQAEALRQALKETSIALHK